MGIKTCDISTALDASFIYGNGMYHKCRFYPFFHMLAIKRRTLWSLDDAVVI